MVFLFIVIVFVVMILTSGIIFHNQFKVQEKRVLCEYEPLKELFHKRVEVLEKLLTQLFSLDSLEEDIKNSLSEAQRLIEVVRQGETLSEVVDNNIMLTPVVFDIFDFCQDANATVLTEESSLFLNELHCIEEDIEDKKEAYNTAVRVFNISIRIFPAKYVANFMKLKELPQFIYSNQ